MEGAGPVRGGGFAGSAVAGGDFLTVLGDADAGAPWFGQGCVDGYGGIVFGEVVAEKVDVPGRGAGQELVGFQGGVGDQDPGNVVAGMIEDEPVLPIPGELPDQGVSAKDHVGQHCS